MSRSSLVAVADSRNSTFNTNKSGWTDYHKACPCLTQYPAAEARDGVERRPLRTRTSEGQPGPLGNSVVQPGLRIYGSDANSTLSNSWTPVGFSPDTVSLEVAAEGPSPATPPQPQVPVKIQAVTGASEWAQVRVSQDPLLRFQWFAGALSELRETFYLIDCWLIVKGCNSTTARWKRCSRQGIGKDVMLPGSP